MDKLLDSARRSALMRRVKRRDTAPEMSVRRALRELGVGYRLNRPDLPGRPDVVLAGRRIAIFVHGCYWHGHSDCRRGALAKSNVEFWSVKISGNRQRDARVAEALQAAGWHVLVVWECAAKDTARLAEALSVYLFERKSAAGAATRGTLVVIG